MQRDRYLAEVMEYLYPGIGANLSPGSRGAFPRTSPHENLTWHHHPYRPGIGQLTPRGQHGSPGPQQQTYHPNGAGGVSNWGN